MPGTVSRGGMKIPLLHGPLFALAAFLSVGSGATPAHAEAPPVFPLEKVIVIANKALAEKGEKDVFIRSIELTKPAVFSDKQNWVVTWSRDLPASKPRLREIGISVSMDGRAVRVVK